MNLSEFRDHLKETIVAKLQEDLELDDTNYQTYNDYYKELGEYDYMKAVIDKNCLQFTKKIITSDLSDSNGVVKLQTDIENILNAKDYVEDLKVIYRQSLNIVIKRIIRETEPTDKKFVNLQEALKLQNMQIIKDITKKNIKEYIESSTSLKRTNILLKSFGIDKEYRGLGDYTKEFNKLLENEKYEDILNTLCLHIEKENLVNTFLNYLFEHFKQKFADFNENKFDKFNEEFDNFINDVIKLYESFSLFKKMYLIYTFILGSIDINVKLETIIDDELLDEKVKSFTKLLNTEINSQEKMEEITAQLKEFHFEDIIFEQTINNEAANISISKELLDNIKNKYIERLSILSKPEEIYKQMLECSKTTKKIVDDYNRKIIEIHQSLLDNVTNKSVKLKTHYETFNNLKQKYDDKVKTEKKKIDDEFETKKNKLEEELSKLDQTGATMNLINEFKTKVSELKENYKTLSIIEPDTKSLFYLINKFDDVFEKYKDFTTKNLIGFYYRSATELQSDDKEYNKLLENYPSDEDVEKVSQSYPYLNFDEFKEKNKDEKDMIIETINFINRLLNYSNYINENEHMKKLEEITKKQPLELEDLYEIAIEFPEIIKLYDSAVEKFGREKEQEIIKLIVSKLHINESQFADFKDTNNELQTFKLRYNLYKTGSENNLLIKEKYDNYKELVNDYNNFVSKDFSNYEKLFEDLYPKTQQRGFNPVNYFKFNFFNVNIPEIYRNTILDLTLSKKNYCPMIKKIIKLTEAEIKTYKSGLLNNEKIVFEEKKLKEAIASNSMYIYNDSTNEMELVYEDIILEHIKKNFDEINELYVLQNEILTQYEKIEPDIKSFNKKIDEQDEIDEILKDKIIKELKSLNTKLIELNKRNVNDLELHEDLEVINYDIEDFNTKFNLFSIPQEFKDNIVLFDAPESTKTSIHLEGELYKQILDINSKVYKNTDSTKEIQIYTGELNNLNKIMSEIDEIQNFSLNHMEKIYTAYQLILIKIKQQLFKNVYLCLSLIFKYKELVIKCHYNKLNLPQTDYDNIIDTFLHGFDFKYPTITMDLNENQRIYQNLITTIKRDDGYGKNVYNCLIKPYFTNLKLFYGIKQEKISVNTNTKKEIKISINSDFEKEIKKFLNFETLSNSDYDSVNEEESTTEYKEEDNEIEENFIKYIDKTIVFLDSNFKQLKGNTTYDNNYNSLITIKNECRKIIDHHITPILTYISNVRSFDDIFCNGSLEYNLKTEQFDKIYIDLKKCYNLNENRFPVITKDFDTSKFSEIKDLCGIIEPYTNDLNIMDNLTFSFVNNSTINQTITEIFNAFEEGSRALFNNDVYSEHIIIERIQNKLESSKSSQYDEKGTNLLKVLKLNLKELKEYKTLKDRFCKLLLSIQLPDNLIEEAYENIEKYFNDSLEAREIKSDYQNYLSFDNTYNDDEESNTLIAGKYIDKFTDICIITIYNKLSKLANEYPDEKKVKNKITEEYRKYVETIIKDLKSQFTKESFKENINKLYNSFYSIISSDNTLEVILYEKLLTHICTNIILYRFKQNLTKLQNSLLEKVNLNTEMEKYKIEFLNSINVTSKTSYTNKEAAELLQNYFTNIKFNNFQSTNIPIITNEPLKKYFYVFIYYFAFLYNILNQFITQSIVDKMKDLKYEIINEGKTLTIKCKCIEINTKNKKRTEEKEVIVHSNVLWKDYLNPRILIKKDNDEYTRAISEYTMNKIISSYFSYEHVIQKQNVYKSIVNSIYDEEEAIYVDSYQTKIMQSINLEDTINLQKTLGLTVLTADQANEIQKYINYQHILYSSCHDYFNYVMKSMYYNDTGSGLNAFIVNRFTQPNIKHFLLRDKSDLIYNTDLFETYYKHFFDITKKDLYQFLDLKSNKKIELIDLINTGHDKGLRRINQNIFEITRHKQKYLKLQGFKIGGDQNKHINYIDIITHGDLKQLWKLSYRDKDITYLFDLEPIINDIIYYELEDYNLNEIALLRDYNFNDFQTFYQQITSTNTDLIHDYVYKFIKNIVTLISESKKVFKIEDVDYGNTLYLYDTIIQDAFSQKHLLSNIFDSNVYLITNIYIDFFNIVRRTIKNLFKKHFNISATISDSGVSWDIKINIPREQSTTESAYNLVYYSIVSQQKIIKHFLNEELKYIESKNFDAESLKIYKKKSINEFKSSLNQIQQYITEYDSDNGVITDLLEIISGLTEYGNKEGTIIGVDTPIEHLEFYMIQPITVEKTKKSLENIIDLNELLLLNKKIITELFKKIILPRYTYFSRYVVFGDKVENTPFYKFVNEIYDDIVKILSSDNILILVSEQVEDSIPNKIVQIQQDMENMKSHFYDFSLKCQNVDDLINKFELVQKLIEIFCVIHQQDFATEESFEEYYNEVINEVANLIPNDFIKALLTKENLELALETKKENSNQNYYKTVIETIKQEVYVSDLAKIIVEQTKQKYEEGPAKDYIKKKFKDNDNYDKIISGKFGGKQTFNETICNNYSDVFKLLVSNDLVNLYEQDTEEAFMEKLDNFLISIKTFYPNYLETYDDCRYLKYVIQSMMTKFNEDNYKLQISNINIISLTKVKFNKEFENENSYYLISTPTVIDNINYCGKAELYYKLKKYRLTTDKTLMELLFDEQEREKYQNINCIIDIDNVLVKTKYTNNNINQLKYNILLSNTEIINRFNESYIVTENPTVIPNLFNYYCNDSNLRSKFFQQLFSHLFSVKTTENLKKISGSFSNLLEFFNSTLNFFRYDITYMLKYKDEIVKFLTTFCTVIAKNVIMEREENIPEITETCANNFSKSFDIFVTLSEDERDILNILITKFNIFIYVHNEFTIDKLRRYLLLNHDETTLEDFVILMCYIYSNNNNGIASAITNYFNTNGNYILSNKYSETSNIMFTTTASSTSEVSNKHYWFTEEHGQDNFNLEHYIKIMLYYQKIGRVLLKKDDVNFTLLLDLNTNGEIKEILEKLNKEFDLKADLKIDFVKKPIITKNMITDSESTTKKCLYLYSQLFDKNPDYFKELLKESWVKKKIASLFDIKETTPTELLKFIQENFKPNDEEQNEEDDDEDLFRNLEIYDEKQNEEDIIQQSYSDYLSLLDPNEINDIKLLTILFNANYNTDLQGCIEKIYQIQALNLRIRKFELNEELKLLYLLDPYKPCYPEDEGEEKIHLDLNNYGLENISIYEIMINDLGNEKRKFRLSEQKIKEKEELYKKITLFDIIDKYVSNYKQTSEIINNLYEIINVLVCDYIIKTTNIKLDSKSIIIPEYIPKDLHLELESTKYTFSLKTPAMHVVEALYNNNLIRISNKNHIKNIISPTDALNICVDEFSRKVYRKIYQSYIDYNYSNDRLEHEIKIYKFNINEAEFKGGNTNNKIPTIAIIITVIVIIVIIVIIIVLCVKLINKNRNKNKTKHNK